MNIKLEVIKGPETGRVFVFEKPDTFIVGRARDAHFRLSDDDPYISRRHFMLEVCPPKAVFKDLDSTNTPLINGIPRIEDEAEPWGRH